MFSWKTRTIATAAAVLLLTTSVAVSATARSDAHAAKSASPRETGAQISATHLPKGVVNASPGVGPQAVNGLLDADVAIYAVNAVNYTSLAAEGRLHMVLVSGTHYVGKFTDNLSGGSTFTAGVRNNNGMDLNGDYTIYTGNGKFTFQINGTFTSTVPSKYGHAAKIGTVVYAPHSYTQQPPLTVSMNSFSIGGFHSFVTGTLTLTTDALRYLVQFNAKHHVNSSFAYTQSGHLHTYLINSFGQYTPPDGSGDGFLTVILLVGKAHVYLEDLKEDTGGQSIISGSGLSGYGDTTSQVSFSAHL